MADNAGRHFRKATRSPAKSCGSRSRSDQIVVECRGQLQDRSHRRPRRCSARISAGRRWAGTWFHDHVHQGLPSTT